MSGTSAVRVWSSAAAILLVLSGCATEAPRDSTMTVDTVAGVVHVRHSADAARWRLREVASIGSAEGPGSFGRVRSIVADGDGNIYVADNQVSEIRVFGPDGAYLRTFGRQGSGPGEFTDIYSLAWMGDSLAVLDPRSGKISLLSPTGEWVGQIPHPPITGPDIRLHSVGREVYSFDVAATPNGQPVRKYLRYVGGRTDTLPYPAQEMSGPRGTILCPHPTGGGLSFFTNPYIPRPIQSPAPETRVALVNSAEYRIHLLSTGGDTAFVIEKRHEAATIPDAEWEEATRSHREWAAKNPGAKCDPLEFTRPAGKPAIRTIFFDDAGRLWVEATTSAGHTFDLFDGHGVHIAHMASPVRRQASVPPYVRGDRLYLVTTDSLDVQSVKAYEIER